MNVRKALVVAVAALMLAPLAPGGSAAAACSGGSSRDISGTIKGADGLFVNAQVSLALFTSSNQLINNQGCAISAGYAQNFRINTDGPADGGTQGEVDWRFDDVPANAHHFTLEVYPRQPTSSEVTWDFYGGVTERTVIIGSGVTGLRLRLPVVCGRDGGTTGGLHVRAFTNGHSVNISRVLALSQSRGADGIQGYRVAYPNTSTADVDSFASNQRWSVLVSFPGTTRGIYDVPVRPCQRTEIWAYSGVRPILPARWAKSSASVSGNYFPVVGDFDANGKDDLFWYGPGAAADSLWLAKGAGFEQHPISQSGSFRPTAGDYNGDGVDDIFWFGPGSAPDERWQFEAGTADHTEIAESVRGSTNTWPRSGDFDGNGFDDIAWYTSGGASSVWRFSANGRSSVALSPPGAGYTLNTGDIDGNFVGDLFWYNAFTGKWYIGFGQRNGSFTLRAGSYAANAHPVVGDFSGDFRTDVLMYEPGSASDFLLRGRANTSPYFSQESTNQGATGTYLYQIPGDWNGDGYTDIFWYQPGSGADGRWRSVPLAWVPQAG